jgi:FixJ family two-component response regulator
MIAQYDIKARRPTVVAVGGDIVDRASLCYEAGNANLHIEPVAMFDELTPRDFAVADVFIVWEDLRLVERLKARIGASESLASVIVLQSRPSIERVVAAMSAGASDVLEWPCRPTAFEDAVVAVIQRARTRMPLLERTQRARARLQELSGREREVLLCVARGLSNKQIADELSISHRTVEIHRSNALGKLDVRHSADAIRLVIEATLYDDETASDEGRRTQHRA